MAKGRKTGGRQAGTPNKRTAEAAAAIEDAFAYLQGEKGKDLRTWSKENTDDFYKLLFPKLLPVQMQMGVGAGSGRLVIEWQTDQSAG